MTIEFDAAVAVGSFLDSYFRERKRKRDNKVTQAIANLNNWGFRLETKIIIKPKCDSCGGPNENLTNKCEYCGNRMEI